MRGGVDSRVRVDDDSLAEAGRTDPAVAVAHSGDEEEAIEVVEGLRFESFLYKIIYAFGVCRRYQLLTHKHAFKSPKKIDWTYGITAAMESEEFAAAFAECGEIAVIC